MTRDELIRILDRIGQRGIFDTNEAYSEFESYVLALDERYKRYSKESQENLSKYFKYKNAFDVLYEKVSK